MSDGLTLLCVHAHPDDESSSTGGVLRTYADEGVRTVLVTCTDGALGDSPDGVTPDARAPRARRGGGAPRRRAAHRGRHPRRDAPRDAGLRGLGHGGLAAERRAGLVLVDAGRRRRAAPRPDPARGAPPGRRHLRRATASTGTPTTSRRIASPSRRSRRRGSPPALFYTAIPKSAFATVPRGAARGGDRGPRLGLGLDADDPPFGTPDEQIGIIVDVAAVADAKFDALSAHSSQTDDSFFLKMGRERFRELFRNEWFVRAIDPFGRTGVDDDLFAGWR